MISKARKQLRSFASTHEYAIKMKIQEVFNKPRKLGIFYVTHKWLGEMERVDGTPRRIGAVLVLQS